MNKFQTGGTLNIFAITTFFHLDRVLFLHITVLDGAITPPVNYSFLASAVS